MFKDIISKNSTNFFLGFFVLTAIIYMVYGFFSNIFIILAITTAIIFIYFLTDFFIYYSDSHNVEKLLHRYLTKQENWLYYKMYKNKVQVGKTTKVYLLDYCFCYNDDISFRILTYYNSTEEDIVYINFMHDNKALAIFKIKEHLLQNSANLFQKIDLMRKIYLYK
jgi:predicted membrane protein